MAGAVLQSTPAAVVLVNGDATVAAVNPAAAALLGGTDRAVGQQAAGLLARSHQVGELRQVLLHVARTRSPDTYEARLPGPHGSCRSVAWAVSPVPGAEPLLALVGLDISATRSQLEDMQSRAWTDELTGLANRAQLLRTLARYAGTGAAVLFCDLNGFKQVNDTYGHAAGDEVLVEVARRLVPAVRGEDLVVRLGGDEFVVVAPAARTADPDALRRRVLGALRQPMLLSGGLVVLVGAAVGVARLEAGAEPLDVLQQADRQMYAAKPSRTSRAGLVPPVAGRP